MIVAKKISITVDTFKICTYSVSQCYLKMKRKLTKKFVMPGNLNPITRSIWVLKNTFSTYEVIFVKVAFFQKVQYVFQISNKKMFKKTILNLKFKFPAKNSKVLLAGNSNSKFRIVCWNIFFERFGDLKKGSHFLKKSHL